MHDYVVIGAGIAGASVGYRLSNAGADVLLLERESQPCYHSTGRSAAMFIESYGTEQIRALTRASHGFYESPPAGFTENPILIPRGTLYVAQPGQETMLEDAYRVYAKQGLTVERLSRADAVGLVGCLAPDKISTEALLDVAASDIDVHALHGGFLRGMRAAGAKLQCDAEVVGAKREDSGWAIQLKDGETLEARAVVNAAGAWADTVAQLFAVRPCAIQPKRRTAFLFEAPQDIEIRKWPCVLGADESFYFKPDAGLLLGSPANADPVPAQDVQPEEMDVALGIHRIEEITTLRIRRPKHTWAGLRSFAPDHEFVIGWDAQQPGFFWLAGQGGYGIQTAAAASDFAAQLLLGQQRSKTLSDFGVSAAVMAPDRFKSPTEKAGEKT